MSDSLTEAQFNRLSRTIMGNPSASVRKEALLEIRKLDHAGLGDLYQQVIADDKDDDVRDLAQNLLNKYEIQEALKRGSFEKPAATIPVPEPEPTSEPTWLERNYPSEPKPSTTTLGELLEKPSGPAWTCRFCGTENSGGIQCASCGAERNLDIITEEALRKRKSQENSPLGFNDVFLLQPTNMSYLLGQSKLVSTMGRLGLGCTALFLLPFVAIGLFVIIFAGTEWRNYYILDTSGVVVRGQYTDKYITTDDDDGGTTYYVDYVYEVNERPFIGNHSVSWDVYNRAGIGEGVSILYAPNDPSLSRIEGTNDISTPVFLTFFAVCWNLISWGVFLGIIIGGIRDRQLSRDGQLVRGELLGMTGRSGSKGAYSVTAEYSFLPPDEGDVIFNKQTAQRNDLRGATFPDKGTPIMVLYKNRKHFKML
jgi:hypothetical protein